ncbi:MAG: MFS transporter [Marinisporobacter sp.]|jgi:fucose permease|nr:MFS transporter [Marinisporobacter sp.]
MKNKKEVKTWPVVVLLLMMYVIVAMSDNFKGIFVPAFKSEFGIDNTQIGYVLMASLFAYAVFQYVGGILIGKVGYKKVIALGFLIAMAAIGVIVSCKSYILLIAGLFILHTGMAMFNVGVNTLGPVLPVASTAVLMSMITFSYGVSSTTIQKLVGYLLFRGVAWRNFFIFMLCATGALFVYLLMIKIPEKEKDDSNVKMNASELWKNKILWLYILLAGFYLASDYGTGNWFANYMDEGYGLDANNRAFYVSLFFGTMTFGRLIGGFIADKLGHFRSIIIFSVLATVFIFTGVTLGESGLLVIAIGGFFFSLIFPVTITTISTVFKDNASYAIGMILMAGTLISMLVNFFIGVLNDAIGVQNAYYAIAVCLGLTTIFTICVRKNVEGNKDEKSVCIHE